MQNHKLTKMNRRSFLGSVSLLLTGGSLIGTTSPYKAKVQESHNLWTEFTVEEKKIIDSSVMAKDIITFNPEEYSCAESIFKAAIRFLGKTEDLVNIAAGFGGGLHYEDLCGLLTGGIMSIGLSLDDRFENRQDLHEYTEIVVPHYFEWFQSLAPIHCRDLEPQYNGKEEYLRMCQRVAAKVEELINPQQ